MEIVTGLKYPDGSNLREKGLILARSSRIQSFLVGRGRCWSLKQLTSHIHHPGQREVNASYRSLPFLHSTVQDSIQE